MPELNCRRNLDVVNNANVKERRERDKRQQREMERKRENIKGDNNKIKIPLLTTEIIKI